MSEASLRQRPHDRNPSVESGDSSRIGCAARSCRRSTGQGLWIAYSLQFKGSYTGAAVGTIDFDVETAFDSIHNELFHRQRLPEIARYQHSCMTGVASALAALDNPLFVEANGKTVLDNTLVVIGTGVRARSWAHRRLPRGRADGDAGLSE